MSLEEQNPTTIGATALEPAESEMVQRERYEEIRRLYFQEWRTIAAIARQLDLDRKTVCRCVRPLSFQPDRRAPREDTLLAEHAEWLRSRAADWSLGVDQDSGHK